MRELAEYAIQLGALAFITAFVVAAVAALATFALGSSSRTLELARRFWMGPGAYVCITAWVAFTLGFFIAANWAAAWNIEPVK